MSTGYLAAIDNNENALGFKQLDVSLRLKYYILKSKC